MKKRYISYSIILSLFVMSLTACGRSNTAADQAVNPTPAPAQDAPADTTDPKADTTPESSGSSSNSMKISLDPEDTADTTEHEYTINYTDSKTGKICVVDFSSDGHSYEMCVSGLAEEFTDDQINTLINAFLSGNVATIESDDLIDAEKFSEYIYGTLGDWVFSDDYRNVDDWGDHSMCWAGSASDMLWSAGWARLALEKNTELSFKNVDDLFSYFVEHYDNNSQMTQYDAIEWFMAGGYEPRSTDKTPANLPGYNPEDYWEIAMLDDGDSIDKGIELIKKLKDGASVGLTVSLNQTEYPLKDDEDNAATYDNISGNYHKEVYIELDDGDEKTESGFYVYNDLGNAVKVEKKDDDTYITEDGKEYDVFNVLKGKLYPLESGYYAVVNEDGGVDYFAECDDGEVDFDNGTTLYSVGMGSHAITVSGYIIDVDEQQPLNSVKALFITDPDNDAHDHNMPKEVRGNEQASKAGRPNTMQLFTASCVTLEDSDDDGNNKQTLNLDNYMKEAVALIASVTALTPAP